MTSPVLLTWRRFAPGQWELCDAFGRRIATIMPAGETGFSATLPALGALPQNRAMFRTVNAAKAWAARTIDRESIGRLGVDDLAIEGARQ